MTRILVHLQGRENLDDWCWAVATALLGSRTRWDVVLLLEAWVEGEDEDEEVVACPTLASCRPEWSRCLASNLGPALRTRWMAVSQVWQSPWDLGDLSWQRLDVRGLPQASLPNLGGWWVDSDWFPPSSGFVGPFEPTRAFPGGTKKAPKTCQWPLPFAQVLDEAGVPPDRCTELWLLDGMSRSWASYSPDRLVRATGGAASQLQWKHSLRAVSLGELEKVLGFAAGHTAPAVPSGTLKTASASRRRQQLLERSSMPRVLWPGVQAGVRSLHVSWGYMELEEFLQREMANSLLVNPVLGSTEEVRSSSGVSPARGDGASEPWNAGQRLVLRHMRGLSSRGSDVRLSTGALLTPGAGRVQSVQSNLWRWRSAFNWQWQLPKVEESRVAKEGQATRPQEHINVLELRALVVATRWALRSYKSLGLTTLRLTDSRVVMGVASKYRSSSKVLQRQLRKLAALELGGSCRFCTGFIRSDWNPADEGSRKPGR